jgi:hypothetical protein
LGSDSRNTPAVATLIASSVTQPGSSCRNTLANSATCSASVFEYAAPTTKLRCFIAASIAAVAASCPSAPSISQPK